MEELDQIPQFRVEALLSPHPVVAAEAEAQVLEMALADQVAQEGVELTEVRLAVVEPLVKETLVAQVALKAGRMEQAEEVAHQPLALLVVLLKVVMGEMELSHP